MRKFIAHSASIFLALASLISPPPSFAETYSISTVAGNGTAGFSGDGGPALQGQFNNPAGVSILPDGTIYVADYRNRRIRKISPDGTLSTVAGSDKPYALPEIGDGGPATSAMLAAPYGVRATADGTLYIADQGGNRVRKVSPDGIVTTFAGNGAREFSGDGGPAVSAALAGPNDVRFDSKGNAYIADTGNDRVRRVDAEGVITTFAGAGDGFSGDGGPAAEARFNGPCALFVDRNDEVYFCDIGNHAVWKVDRSGTAHRLAGTGKPGYGGDGGPAREAQLKEPCGVAVDPAGQVFIADTNNHRIRVIRTSGVIETIAGKGQYGYSGDGGPATEARIRIPDLIDFDANGNLYLAEFRGNIIRKLERLDLADKK